MQSAVYKRYLLALLTAILLFDYAGGTISDTFQPRAGERMRARQE